WRPRPALEFVLQGNNIFALCVETRDLMLPFGPASLDSHSRTFLNIKKSDVLNKADKQNMLGTFQEKTADAYGSNPVDPTNTLLIEEGMEGKDRDIYKGFGFADEEVPPFRPFLGSRVSQFLLATTRRGVAAGSWLLASEEKVRELMRKGGISHFETNQDVSKF